MDKDSILILNILSSSKEGLTTSEIAKMLYEKYGAKVSKTIVKNYLWSIFRDMIIYDPSSYTYKIKLEKSQVVSVETISVVKKENPVRSVEIGVYGTETIVAYDKNLPIEKVLKALALLNFQVTRSKKKIDLIKQLNRLIENLDLDEI